MRGGLAGLVLLAAWLWPTAAPAATPVAPKSLNVLFVGNSLTYGNDLPTTFETLYAATEPGTVVHTQMLAVGGAVLRDHLDTGHLAAPVSTSSTSISSAIRRGHAARGRSRARQAAAR